MKKKVNKIFLGSTCERKLHTSDVFVEVVPILDIVPDTEFEINAGIGARFYFR